MPIMARTADTGSAGDQLNGSVDDVGVPYEPSTDRTAKLKLIPDSEFVGEVRRHLAVWQTLDDELDVLLFRRGRDRVAALRGVAVLSRQSDVEMLPRQVAVPGGHVEDEPVRAGALTLIGDDAGQLPGQSPAYRCSRHGSPSL